MPEYLAPGVFVEEVSFQTKSIEGVGTTTTGFVGPTRYGPLDIEPDIITSLVEFERTYGGREQLVYSGEPMDNYMWHAVRSFFEEGGTRLYISRVYTPPDSDSSLPGHAAGFFDTSPSPLTIYSRFPGAAGDARVTLTLKAGQNVLVNDGGTPAVRSMLPRDVVWLRSKGGAPTSPPVATSPPTAPSAGFYLALYDPSSDSWRFSSTGDDFATAGVHLSDLLPAHWELRIVTTTVNVDPLASSTGEFVVADLPLDPMHQRGGSPDSLFAYFAEQPANQSRARTLPLLLLDAEVAALGTGLDVLNSLLAAAPGVRTALTDPASSAAARGLWMVMSGGSDGQRPEADEYEGQVDPVTDRKTGLMQFEDLDDIAIVAAPGSTFGYEDASYQPTAQTIIHLLIDHCERMRYRIAVIDSGNDQAIADVRAMRAQLDSSYAALYYPWIRILDPLSQQEIYVPPSGSVCGIYARNDINRAVYKAPANEVVNLALGFERFLNKAQQEVLNPEGINCFRYFEGRGMRLWGARTISSDPEWKYVNLRRYFAFLEHSIDKGTQWAVFEPNGPLLWANLRRAVQEFLLGQFQNGALLGDKPEQAYFVRCDRSTMSQDDLDNGRLVCLVGVAALKPAEFVIFRIGQWTADSTN
ncbi:phage tail sheath family protein [Scleromatobacter humisilvae]|uniref:Phage tail sheath subtilisin-like domain-containing protein n=1 Tax=Scleromatobacter humisilvae TaxID=2897159 RepID=A0A9X1YSM1_9BURK|nr:phage tail sheath subtilisin-like domain-containing protein [Scleromatobacter humisilvae]MCK9688536.1 phage tail sheath subtilisin-like domain-containing protein [Scleromatobacter humisilvae]